MNTKTTFAIIATVAILAAAITPTFLTQASAKITETPPTCERPSGNERDGPCPGKSGDTEPIEEDTDFENPQGKQPGGHNKE
jgi:hypothetical protein